jgi:Glu-tRNA(Gln) amidotransferase subunit E-like FAD-binding protein
MMLLKSYFPPNEVVQVPPSRNPLFVKLTQTLDDPDEIRSRIANIIKENPVENELRDGLRTLERFYMGRLMKELRGKVDSDRAKRIIRDEIDKNFEIVPPVKQGGYYGIRKK